MHFYANDAQKCKKNKNCNAFNQYMKLFQLKRTSSL